MTEPFDAVLAEMRAATNSAFETPRYRFKEWADRLSAAHAAELAAANEYAARCTEANTQAERENDQLRAEVAERDARIAEAQETNRRLNRRVQMAEAAIPSYQKLIAIPPDGDGVRLANGSMGRALLTWYCEQLTERAEAAERDAYVSEQGSVTVDWDDDPQRQLSIMVKRDGSVAFSAFANGERFSGDAKSPEFWRALSALASSGQGVEVATGMFAVYPQATDRATFLYFNGKGDVPVGEEVRIVAPTQEKA